MSEFSLIDRYFAHIGENRNDVILSVGDDGAIIQTGNVQQCIAVDTLVRGVHFPEQTQARDIGYKSLAVNLSDMAAMGAKPQWATLAITLSEFEDEQWIKEFALGMDELARQHSVQIIGGDTSRGTQLTISVQIAGIIEDGKALRRDAAKPGDKIFVTGTIGDAAIGLRQLSTASADDYFLQRLNRPTPRVVDMQILKPYINAAIDISDGLLADLGHIMQRSELGATIQIEDVPLSEGVTDKGIDDEEYQFLLSGGDDYEICFTVADEHVNTLLDIASQHGIVITQIGQMVKGNTLQCLYRDGRELAVTKRGYDHFA
ncbi:MAG: thiamine-phosphate kinase [Gammaproteobacteria bacterium]|nr:thiamine-phosphate kinase [Gammaproteobacteria bacterium]